MAKLAESPEFHISRKLVPGDIEVVHNPTIFHSRADVQDGEVSALQFQTECTTVDVATLLKWHSQIMHKYSYEKRKCIRRSVLQACTVTFAMLNLA